MQKEQNNFSIELSNVSKTFSGKTQTSLRDLILRNSFHSKINHKKKALENINLEISKGEIFGIIGRNGSGKSTLINIMMNTINPDKGGIVKTDGKMIRLALGMGVDNNLSARDNIYVNGSVLGLSFRKIGSLFDEILEFAGLMDYVDTPVKYFSKGMRNRLLFSIAMHANADVFLLDEFFGGVGDEDFKKKSDEAFQQKILEGNTLIIVSHSLKIIKNYCQRTLWLHNGRIQYLGDTKTALRLYRESFLSDTDDVLTERQIS